MDPSTASLPLELLQRILHYLVTGQLDLHRSPDWLPQPYYHPESTQCQFPRDPAYKPVGTSRHPLLTVALVNKHWSFAALSVLYDYVFIRSQEDAVAVAETLQSSPSLAHMVHTLDFAHPPSARGPDSIAEIIMSCINVQHVRLTPASSRSCFTLLSKCPLIRTFCIVRTATSYDVSSSHGFTSYLNFGDLTHLIAHWPDLQNLYMYSGASATNSDSTSNSVPWTVPPNLPRVKGLVIFTRTSVELFRQFLSLTCSLEQLTLSLTEAGQVDEVVDVLRSSKDTLRHLDLEVHIYGHLELPAAFYSVLPNLHHLILLKLAHTFFPPNLLETALPPNIELLDIFLYQDDFAAVAKAADSETPLELSSDDF
ncbi:hypothetical protein JAAARDRAFT_199250 [Jaapia argillacea MUCL 33604]|uniref:F-box domain-containing protein n=1 Tax=Jaapia argillacea MUCL 33604 TaxID=933084 RepID=A0A067PJK5_9AGAM|nr:hypothetical protein JAAARDRAFT_199250 [Jaapia argillacea MUCL 33604]